MKKEIKNLTQEIFRDRELLRYIGFSQQEAEIFYHLIQGESITQIAKALKLSPYHIRKIRNQKFHSIPIGELFISKRTINALIAGGIKNTNQLCERSSRELMLFRNIGIKAVKEIEEALEKQSLSLRA